MMDLKKYVIDTVKPVFNDEPIYANVDEWVNRDKNILWITGLSGGGKGYVAKKIAEKYSKSIPVTIIELDKFENYIWYMDAKSEDNINVASGDKLIYEWIRNNFKPLRNSEGALIDHWDNNYTKYVKDLNTFIEWFRGYAEAHRDRLFICEGIQIFMDNSFEFLNRYDPMIIIRTSKVKSMVKIMKREHNEIRNRFHPHSDAQRKLGDFVDRFGYDMSKVTYK